MWLQITAPPPPTKRDVVVRKLTPRSIPPVGAGPYTERRDGPAQERVEPEGFRQVYDNYEDGNEQAWRTDRHGSAEHGKCAYCDESFAMVSPTLLRCRLCSREMTILEDGKLGDAPRQMRQLNVGAPKERKKQPDLENETLSDSDMPRSGIGSNPAFDWRDFPSATGPALGA
jgi:hypothetical protein